MEEIIMKALFLFVWKKDVLVRFYPPNLAVWLTSWTRDYRFMPK